MVKIKSTVLETQDHQIDKHTARYAVYLTHYLLLMFPS